MRVLMFGWEFPPHNSGGLGVACRGLVNGLVSEGVEVSFVLPRRIATSGDAANFLFADPNADPAFSAAALYNPYLSAVQHRLLGIETSNRHGSSLIDEVLWYASRAGEIAAAEPHDVIHAHDWLTFPAGIEAKRVSGRPFVVHVHATEFDRTGNGNPNEAVYRIEKDGMESADRVIAVSNFTKNIIVEKYGIAADKIDVVHNVIETPEPPGKMISAIKEMKRRGKKIILFVGRLTLQKGPDYFLQTAKRVLDQEKKAHFVIVGSGDMQNQLIELAASLGIAEHVSFVGFLRGGELSSVYSAADVFLMPSVSEPFGLTCLEALSFGVPVIVSRQSGVSEVARHCLKVDFWDVQGMAAKILAILRYPALRQVLSVEAPREATRVHWSDIARKCQKIYRRLSARVKELSG